MTNLSDDELAAVYDIELTALIDKHCPDVKVHHRPRSDCIVARRGSGGTSRE